MNYRSFIWALIFLTHTIVRVDAKDIVYTVDQFFLKPRYQWNLPFTYAFMHDSGQRQEGWYITGSWQHYKSNQAYDKKGKKNSLSTLVFKDAMTVRDIFLASALAYQGLLTLPGSTVFGSTKDEQYIACLAPTQIDIDAQRSVTKALLSIFYTRGISCSCFWSLSGGLTATIKRVAHELCCMTTHNGLLSCSTPTVVGQNNITQFFSDYSIDFSDFFINGILQPKGLDYNSSQQVAGLAGITPLCMAEYNNIDGLLSHAVLGAQLYVPAAKKSTADKVWQPLLNTTESAHVSLFAGVYMQVKPSFNPFITVMPTFFMPAYRSMRIATHKTEKSTIFMPERFTLHTIAPFAQYDAQVPAFADHVYRVRMSNYYKIQVAIGNQWNDLFGSIIDGALYYRLTYAHHPTIRLAHGHEVINSSAAASYYQYTRHAIACAGAVQLGPRLGIIFGAQHTFAGKNCSKKTVLFATATGLF